MTMIDLHCHILHGVDDGPEAFEISMEMLRYACDTGIRAIVATPHILDCYQSEDLILSRYRKLNRTAVEEKLDIEVYLASEINFQFGIEDFLESCIGTYRGMGRYFLVETTLTHYPKHFEETLYKILERGKQPIFAHPERVGPIVGRKDLIADLVSMGVHMQVNAGSLLGAFGERVSVFAWELVENNLAHFVASDAHSTRRRSFNLDKAWDAISGRIDEDTAERLLYYNPLKVITGETL